MKKETLSKCAYTALTFQLLSELAENAVRLFPLNGVLDESSNFITAFSQIITFCVLPSIDSQDENLQNQQFALRANKFYSPSIFYSNDDKNTSLNDDLDGPLLRQVLKPDSRKQVKLALSNAIEESIALIQPIAAHSNFEAHLNDLNLLKCEIEAFDFNQSYSDNSSIKPYLLPAVLILCAYAAPTIADQTNIASREKIETNLFYVIFLSACAVMAYAMHLSHKSNQHSARHYQNNYNLLMSKVMFLMQKTTSICTKYYTNNAAIKLAIAVAIDPEISDARTQNTVDACDGIIKAKIDTEINSAIAKIKSILLICHEDILSKIKDLKVSPDKNEIFADEIPKIKNELNRLAVSLGKTLAKCSSQNAVVDAIREIQLEVEKIILPTLILSEIDTRQRQHISEIISTIIKSKLSNASQTLAQLVDELFSYRTVRNNRLHQNLSGVKRLSQLSFFNATLPNNLQPSMLESLINDTEDEDIEDKTHLQGARHAKHSVRL